MAEVLQEDQQKLLNDYAAEDDVADMFREGENEPIATMKKRLQGRLTLTPTEYKAIIKSEKAKKRNPVSEKIAKVLGGSQYAKKLLKEPGLKKKITRDYIKSGAGGDDLLFMYDLFGKKSDR